MAIKIKVCGLQESSNVESCIDNSADMIGLVFYPKSPRNIEINEAYILNKKYSSLIEIVALVVNASEELIDNIISRVGIKTIQFHGNENIDYLESLKTKYNIKIIKAVSLSSDTLDNIDNQSDAIDYYLFDSPPPIASNRPGGNGLTFDWGLINKLNLKKDWILSGGLTPSNIKEAISITGANFIDVSSGVESKIGKKDNDLITNFIYNARS